jgi:hypothetical protein
VYVVVPSTDIDRCRALGNELIRHIATLDAGKKAINAFWTILQSKEEIESEFLEPHIVDKVCTATGNGFPLLVVNFTYNPDEYASEWFAPIESKFGLIAIKAAIWARHPWPTRQGSGELT